MLSLRIPMRTHLSKDHPAKRAFLRPPTHTKRETKETRKNAERNPETRGDPALRVTGLLNLSLRRIGVRHLLVLGFLYLVGLGSLARLGLGGLLGPLGLQLGL